MFECLTIDGYIEALELYLFIASENDHGNLKRRLQ